MSYDKEYTFLLKKIIKKSIFTEKQLKILLDYLNKRENEREISKGETVITLYGDLYKKGVYFRILKQSINNVKRVIFSLVILTYLDIISHEDITKLMTLINDMSQDEMYEFLKKMEDLIERQIRRRI